MTRTEVLIGGRRYALTCEAGQEERVMELGRQFDARVSELAAALGDIGPERLFLAVGLSLLDELEGMTSEPEQRALEERIRGLERRAATALSQAAERIHSLSRRVEEAG